MRTAACLLFVLAPLGAFAACSDDETAGDDGPTTGAGAAAASSGMSSSSTGAGGGTILTCTEAYTDVPAGACDLLSQNCPAGQGCAVVAGDPYTTECRPDVGTKSAGQACGGNAECVAGMYCVFNACSPVCCPASNEPCGSGLCLVEVMEGPHTVMVCSYLEQCEVLTANACEGGKHCHVLNSEGYAVCVEPASPLKDEGEQCMFLNDCGDQQTCHPPGLAGAVCRYNCFLDGSGQATPGLGGCPDGQTCKDGNTGIRNVGVCKP